MNLEKPIARSIDDSARIMGFSPIELASCALFYAIIDPVLKGIPFSPLIALVIALSLGSVLLFLNRNFPPAHGILFILHLFRERVVSVMPFCLEKERHR
jgi:hypothetical protein